MFLVLALPDVVDQRPLLLLLAERTLFLGLSVASAVVGAVVVSPGLNWKDKGTRMVVVR